VDVESLPFDQYQRYRLVADLVGEVRGDRASLHILDVGGRTALLREFLPQDRVDLVDMEPSESRGLILGDGSRLPFQSGSFDVVAAFDTLEHVPPAHREAFVAECARVSKGYVFLAGPYQAARVDEAEETLIDFLRDKLRVQHRYLAEHRSNGLPDRAATEQGLRAAGLEVASAGHGNLDRWLVLMCLELYLEYDPVLRSFAQRIYRFYNQSLYASDHLEPVYRHVVMGARNGARLPDARRVLGAPGAPAEAMPALLPLAEELLAFDHQRDLLAPELARLHGVVVGLEEDLRQHRLTLQTLGADLDAHRATVLGMRAAEERASTGHAAVVQALEADLAGHRTTVAHLQAEITAHAAAQARLICDVQARDEELERCHGELNSQREQRAALEAVFGHHRHELEAELAHHRQELEAHGHVIADQSARVDDLHAELGASLARARSAEVELDQARFEMARLVGLLRDRRQNLWRAFRPSKYGDDR